MSAVDMYEFYVNTSPVSLPLHFKYPADLRKWWNENAGSTSSITTVEAFTGEKVATHKSLIDLDVEKGILLDKYWDGEL